MNHPYVNNPDNKSACLTCGYDFLSHTKAARCAVCDKIGNVEIQDKLLKCDNCITANTVAFNTMLQDADVMLRLIGEHDMAVRYSGDVFNAKTIANEEIKIQIFNNPENANLSELDKYQKYFNFLADRYNHFQRVIFEHSTIVHDATIETINIANQLRQYGDKVREEIREKIKNSDQLYAPQVINKPKITPKIKTKLNKADALVKAMMAMRNCSETEARLLVEKMNPGAFEEPIVEKKLTVSERLIEAYSKLHNVSLDEAKLAIDSGNIK